MGSFGRPLSSDLRQSQSRQSRQNLPDGDWIPDYQGTVEAIRDETVAIILDSSYIQFFIGMHSFSDRAPFDTSAMMYFSKQPTPETLAEINQLIVEASKVDDIHHDDNAGGEPEPTEESKLEPKNERTLILDATCAPVDIHFPTDVALFNDIREKPEEIIGYLHEGSDTKKPRTYRQKARTLYLRFARNRRPRFKQIRRTLREQLGFLRRDLDIVKEQIARNSHSLTPRQQLYWQTIQGAYRQQLEMYQKRKHKIDDRIVSIHQP